MPRPANWSILPAGKGPCCKSVMSSASIRLLRAAFPHLTTPKYITAVRRSGFSFRSTDIGVVLDLMIHDIDLVLSLVRSPLRQVESLGLALFGERGRRQRPLVVREWLRGRAERLARQPSAGTNHGHLVDAGLGQPRLHGSDRGSCASERSDRAARIRCRTPVDGRACIAQGSAVDRPFTDRANDDRTARRHHRRAERFRRKHADRPAHRKSRAKPAATRSTLPSGLSRRWRATPGTARPTGWSARRWRPARQIIPGPHWGANPRPGRPSGAKRVNSPVDRNSSALRTGSYTRPAAGTMNGARYSRVSMASACESLTKRSSSISKCNSRPYAICGFLRIDAVGLQVIAEVARTCRPRRRCRPVHLDFLHAFFCAQAVRDVAHVAQCA